MTQSWSCVVHLVGHRHLTLNSEGHSFIFVFENTSTRACVGKGCDCCEVGRL